MYVAQARRGPSPRCRRGTSRWVSTGRPPRSVGAALADRAVAFEHQADRVEPRVAAGAARVVAVLGQHLAQRAGRRASPRRAGSSGTSAAAAGCARPARGARPSSRASPGWCAGPARSWSGTPPSAAGRRGRSASASSTRTHSSGRAVGVGHAVVLGQHRVHERVVGVEEVEHRAVVAGRRRRRSGPAPRTSPAAARC